MAGPSFSCFNPCSGGCSSERELAQPDRGISEDVSILVLVDVPRKEFSRLFSRRSCRVSILVLVDVPRKAIALKVYVDGQLFQSLFWWMFLGKQKIRTGAVKASSFNPCSGGCSSESSTDSQHYIGSFSFNPCSGGCSSESGISRPRCTL